MADFVCPVVRISIEEHPNADAIEIARVGGFQSIVKKDEFESGALAVYIPEQAVVPQWLLEELGLWREDREMGGLAGSKGDRVKAIKLRGVLSQGLVYGGLNASTDGRQFLMLATESSGIVPLALGDDASELLGIKKYEPPIPDNMRGQVLEASLAATLKYEIDDIKRVPDLFEDGEEVVITEKIHGTLLQVICVPGRKSNDRFWNGRVAVSSKGMAAQGYLLDHNDPKNLYGQASFRHGLFEKILEHAGPLADTVGKTVFLLGEVYGRTASGSSIQDLTYDDGEMGFRAFDFSVGSRGQGVFFAFKDFCRFCDDAGIPRVPVLYVGPYSKEVVRQHTDGNTTLTERKQIREGVVIRSANEETHAEYGRKIAKSISEAYLLRKGGTEYN